MRRMELKAGALHVVLLAFAMSGSCTVQGFLQLPSSTLSRHVSHARDNFGIPTRGAGRSATAVLRMTRKDGNDDGGNGDRFRPILNPVVAAVLGATLLSGDPTVTLAAQATPTGMTLEPPAIVLAAQSTTAPADLKGLLGEYKQKVEKTDISKTTPTVEAPVPAPTPSPTSAPVPTPPSPSAAAPVPVPVPERAPTPQAPPPPPAVEPAPVTKPVPAPAPVPPPPTPPKAVTPAPPPPKPKPAAPKPAVKKNQKALDAAAKQAKAKANKEKADKEREAKKQLEAKEREIQAERQALVDKIQKTRQKYGPVPSTPKRELP